MRFLSTFITLILCTGFINAQVSVLAKVDHVIPDGTDTQGNIVLNVSGSVSPYTYVWNPGAITTKDLNNITTGQYSVTVTSSSSQTYSNVYSLGYKVMWTNMDRCTFRNDSLISSAPNANTHGFAVSKNTLDANTDGWFEYVVDNVTGTNAYFIGFVDSISPNPNTYTDIDYGIYYTSARQLYYYEGALGGYAVIKAAPKVGDVVKVERVGNVINYKINNVVVRTQTVSGISQKTLKLKANFRSSPVQLVNVGCSFDKLNNTSFINYVEVLPVIKHASDFNMTNGSIKATPKIASSNTYLWQPGGATSQTNSGLGVGTNTLTINDGLSNSSSYKYNVGYKVLWTNLDRAYYRNDSLVSTAPNNTIYGTAISKNTLPANTDGWIEYPIDNLGANHCYIGFSEDASSLQYVVADIDYGICYNGSSKTLNYYEVGTNTPLYYAPRVGDRIRIERVGNSILYKLNGSTLKTTTITGIAQKAFKVKTQLLYNNRLVNVGCSFYNKSNTVYNNYVRVIPTIKHVSRPGVSDGSIKLTPTVPFVNTYSWQGGATTSTISSLSATNYSVTVFDSLANQSSYNYNVGYKALWTDLDRCSLVGDSLYSPTNNTNIVATAVSKNTLLAGTDGWIEYLVDMTVANQYFLGFYEAIYPNQYSYGDMKFGLHFSGGIMDYYEAGTTDELSRYLRAGDLIRVERVGDNVIYKVNNYTLRTISIPGISQKNLKLKANLYAVNRLVNVGCSFPESGNLEFNYYVQVKPDIIHNSSMGTTDGQIKVTPRIPYSNAYTWQPGGSTANPISSLAPGSYTVAVTDSIQNKSTYKYNVGYKISWTNLYNATNSGDTLKGTVTTNGSANSRDTLLPNTNGWIEYVYSEPANKSFYFGFLDVLGGQSVATDIDYGFYWNTAQALYQYQNGTTTIMSYNYRVGDVFRIERSGDTIRYIINSGISKTVVVPGVGAKALMVKAVLVNKAQFIKLGASFTHCKFTASAGSTQALSCTTPTVTLTGTTNAPAGSTYLWTPGNATTLSTNVSATGIYTLKVTHAASACIAKSTVSVIADLSAKATITDYTDEAQKGQVNLCIMGGTPPYNVAWNGYTYGTPAQMYHDLLDSLPGVTVDSIKFTHEIDSLRQRTLFGDLMPGTYPVTVYDQVGNSVQLMVAVGEAISSWGYKRGTATNLCAIPDKTVGDITYNYGSGICITQDGSFIPDNHLAIPASVIDINYPCEVSFRIPTNTSVCYVGIRDSKNAVHGLTNDMSKVTMMSFKGDG
ncbi:MAG TPA: hypothetical protein VGF30_08345, partial [Bacteroidia bacterium]